MNASLHHVELPAVTELIMAASASSSSDTEDSLCMRMPLGVHSYSSLMGGIAAFTAEIPGHEWSLLRGLTEAGALNQNVWISSGLDNGRTYAFGKNFLNTMKHESCK